MAMNLTSGLIGAEAHGPIGWLIWDNPSKLNALSPGMSEDALSVIEAYESDPAIKVVITSGFPQTRYADEMQQRAFPLLSIDAYRY